MKDPQLGENIIWHGRPSETRTPALFRTAGAVFFVVAATALCFAVVTAWALSRSPAAFLLLSLLSTSLGLACLIFPKQWLGNVEYLVTDHHVVWRRGPLRRVIQRSSISYARVLWSASKPGVGTIELVRAVPTGALRRRLLLQLHGLASPTNVLSIIRGRQPSGASSASNLPVAQRLDPDERVIWSARPRPSLHSYIPHGRRRWGTLLVATALGTTVSWLALRMGANMNRLSELGLADQPGAFFALLLGELLAASLVLVVIVHLSYTAVFLPARQLKRTLYLITNRRVLIQREREELHLDRRQIVEVIESPGSDGLHDLFLVLDGPRARALAVSGAFGETERDDTLRPIFQNLSDTEGLHELLLDPRSTAPALATGGSSSVTATQMS